MIRVRPAEPEDSQSLWTWRNDKVARAASLNDAMVPWDEHRRWFDSARSSDTILILVGVDALDRRVGVVRFALDDHADAVVSINVAPEHRGTGIGSRLLRTALSTFQARHPASRVVAQIRAENAASLRIFDREGFTVVDELDGVITAELIPRRLPRRLD